MTNAHPSGSAGSWAGATLRSATRRMLVRRPLTRLERWSGPVFVVLALSSSSAISLPLSSDPTEQVTALYDAHRIGYAVAQVVGLTGIAALLVCLRTLRLSAETQGRRVTGAGVLTAVSAAATNAAVLVLCFAQLTPGGLHRAVVATDVTDDALFLSFALLAAALASSALPRRLRGPAAGGHRPPHRPRGAARRRGPGGPGRRGGR
jgi:hypothetical protein